MGYLTSLTVGLMLVSTSLVVFMDSDEVFAIHEQNQVSVSVNPDFPDPRLMEIPKLGYENGMLTVTKLVPNSRLDLIFEGKEIVNDSMKTSFVINKPGCYLVEEEGQFSATDSNKVCKNADGTITIQGHPHENYIEKRDFFNIDNKDEIITLIVLPTQKDLNIDNKNEIITLIILPTQKDLKFLSACPQNYSELLQACYRNVDDKKFIITSWETISNSIIKHELKHADCDCDFHFVNMNKKLETSRAINDKT